MAYISRYGLDFPPRTSELEIERQMIRHGGQWIGKQGQTIGHGRFFHFKRFEQLLYGDAKLWHVWNELQLKCFLEYRTIGIMGPASSGKTNGAATDFLSYWFVWPECTTVLVCSTTKERLEDRIWGEIKKYFKISRGRWPDLPGHLIEGRMRIVMDALGENLEGRDFRNGLIGVPCKRGGNYVGLGDFAGIKNERMLVAADEVSLLPGTFIFAVSNLDKNPILIVEGLGNPKDTLDALGVLCEPAEELGGWDGGIDQTPKTKTWKTRRPDGIAIQLVGSESPNLDGKLGIPLITQKQIDRDIAQYGKDSLQFTMMNQGMMPRGQGSRRIITRQRCLKNRATDDPVWLNSERTKIGFLDAAGWGGSGGDRCVFGELQFGHEAENINAAEMDITNLISQQPSKNNHKKILALIDFMVVPINVTVDEEPQDQIAAFVKRECVTRNIPPQNFFFEAGMKASLVSAFGKLWSPQTNPIDAGSPPSDREVSAKIQIPCKTYYSKFITEMWYSVRLVIEAGQFRGMTEGVMMEGCAREWTIVGANKIEAESKIKMKEKTGKSPDLFDGLAVGVEGARRLGFVIDTPVNKQYRGFDDAWKDKLRERAKASWAEGNLQSK